MWYRIGAAADVQNWDKPKAEAKRARVGPRKAMLRARRCRFTLSGDWFTDYGAIKDRGQWQWCPVLA